MSESALVSQRLTKRQRGGLSRARRGNKAWCTSSASSPDDGPVPPRIVLRLDEAFRVLEALEDARLGLRDVAAAPGLQDELATVIRLLHGRLGLDQGGVS